MKTTLLTLFTIACLNTAFAQEYIADGTNPGRAADVTIKKNIAKPSSDKVSLNNFAPASVVDTTRRVEDIVIDPNVGSKIADADKSVQVDASPKSEAIAAAEAKAEKAASNRNYAKAEVSEVRTVESGLKASEYKSLVKENSDLLKTDSKNEEALMIRGIAQAQLKKFDEAIFDFNEVISINSSNAKAYYNRGLAKMNLGDFHGGISDMTKVIRLNPGDVDAYFNRAQCKVYLDKSMEAIEDLTVVIKMDPENEEAYLNRGSLKYDLEDIHGACRDWSAIASKNTQAAKYMKRLCADKK